jgi:hypothetical protein
LNGLNNFPRLGQAGHGKARRGLAWQGKARQTRELRADNSSKQFSLAWLGRARLGMAGLGGAWQGKTRQTRAPRAVNSGKLNKMNIKTK